MNDKAWTRFLFFTQINWEATWFDLPSFARLTTEEKEYGITSVSDS